MYLRIESFSFDIFLMRFCMSMAFRSESASLSKFSKCLFCMSFPTFLLSYMYSYMDLLATSNMVPPGNCFFSSLMISFIFCMFVSCAVMVYGNADSVVSSNNDMMRFIVSDYTDWFYMNIVVESVVMISPIYLSASSSMLDDILSYSA